MNSLQIKLGFDPRSVVNRSVELGLIQRPAAMRRRNDFEIYRMRHVSPAQALRVRLQSAGWLEFKTWLAEESGRLGITPHALYNRFNRGHYKDSLKVHRANARLVFVKPA